MRISALTMAFGVSRHSPTGCGFCPIAVVRHNKYVRRLPLTKCQNLPVGIYCRQDLPPSSPGPYVALHTSSPVRSSTARGMRYRGQRLQQGTRARSERMIWHIVTKYARQTGLVDHFAPHDVRRTCAKLCRAAGGDLGQTVPPGPRLHPDRRALPGKGAESEGSRQRLAGARLCSITSCVALRL
jgi:hypothetical protein